MTDEHLTSAPAGWYAAPHAGGQHRYWDGRQWLDAAPPPPLPSPPVIANARAGANPVGTLSLVAAIIGTIFACWPGAFIIGWILLPAAFILGIVGVALPDKVRGPALAGLVISIVGTIAGFVVFFSTLADAFDRTSLLDRPEEVTLTEDAHVGLSSRCPVR